MEEKQKHVKVLEIWVVHVGTKKENTGQEQQIYWSDVVR